MSFVLLRASLVHRETKRAAATAARTEKKGLEASGQEMAPAVRQSLTRPVPLSAEVPEMTAQTHQGHDASGDEKRKEKGSPRLHGISWRWSRRGGTHREADVA